jgi:hypothetical protein
MKKLITAVLTLSVFSTSALGYGSRGHQLVGAIADRRLARKQSVANKVRQLLDGLTLEQVATLPDQIKSWDACGSRPPSTSPVTSKDRVNDELRAFVNANPCNGNPNHNDFHFTDVPVKGGEKYADGEVGRFKFDVVQMIPFCIRVLEGSEPESNPRAITKTVAVILLTHYLGDIHQPLHVGAEYFDANGEPFQPSPANKGFADQGGNKLTLFTLADGQPKSTGRFHGYWDTQTVENAFSAMTNAQAAQQLAKQQPAGWKLSGGVETWSEQLANEILPVAREAHERLEYSDIITQSGEKDIRSGNAKELKKTKGKFYAVWAQQTAKKEIHRAGWRLAFILEQLLD